MNPQVELDELVTATGIQALLEVSRQRVHQLQRAEGFPAPVGALDGRPVYRRQEIQAWNEQRSRTRQRPEVVPARPAQR